MKTIDGTLVIPEGVTEISSYAFKDCTSLKSITIPNTVRSIGSYAFSGCKGLTSIIIPNSVKSINNGAFVCCTGLKSITIGNGVTGIGSYAFDGCTGLTDVHITDLAQWCGIFFGNNHANPLYYADNLYVNDVLVTDLIIPNSVKVIGDWTFSGCTGLTSVTTSESVTHINSSAFSGCTGLTNISIPDSVTSISDCAFSGCTSLRSITIPGGVTRIYNHTFDGCTKLANINIPNNVTYIGYEVFKNCDGLMSKPANYKAFGYDNHQLRCRSKHFHIDKRGWVKGPLKLCENGIHFCTNLFDIFNYYGGSYGTEFVIALCDVSDEQDATGAKDSKRCARWVRPTHILTREELIALLNNPIKGGEQ